MIGIGVTSTPKRKHLLDLCLKQIGKHTPERHLLYVHNDVEGKGVAYSKNECLRNLQNCEHIMLLDDDCFPIMDRWYEFFILYSEFSKHYMYLDNWGQIKSTKFFEFTVMGDEQLYLPEEGPPLKWQMSKGKQTILSYNNCAGVFMYLHKSCVEKVGAFNEKFGRYGFEHVDYSLRIHKAGLSPEPFMCPAGASQVLHSLDYDGPFEGIEATPNLTITEVQEAKAKAIQHFSENPEIYIPL